jgi:[protein-PII] uridylyltransferase
MQYPCSDSDIFLIYQNHNKESAQIEKFIQQAWDLNLNISSNVFALDDFIENVSKHWDISTSFLDAYLLRGDSFKFFGLKRKFFKWIDANINDFITIKQQELSHRHMQNPLFGLEPNCKQHAGGLRDLDYMHWVCKALHINKSPVFFKKHLKISKQEIKEYRKQQIFLASVRYYLHLTSHKREDVIRFEYQPILAKQLHYHNDDRKLAQEYLMKTYFRSTRTVYHLQNQFNYLIEQYINSEKKDENNHLKLYTKYNIVNYCINVSNEDFFIENQQKVLDFFYLLNIYEDFSITTQRALFKVKNYLNADWANSDENITTFIRILKSKQSCKILHSMHEHSILGRYLPFFRNITGQMQHDLLHIYTVDQHTLKVINYLSEFRQIEYANEHNLVIQLSQELNKNYWLVIVAGLFHDLGKGQGGNHSIIGAESTKTFCKRHNLSKFNTKMIVWLVRNHLILSQSSQQLDIHQHGVIENFCKKLSIFLPKNHAINAKFKIKYKNNKPFISRSFSNKKLKRSTDKSILLLKALYLLTVADIKGTNPKAYNSWRASLIDNLFYACLDYLQTKIQVKSFSVISKQQTALMLCDINKYEEIINWYACLNKAFFIRRNVEDIAWISQKIAGQTQIIKSGVFICINPERDYWQWQLWIHTEDIGHIFAHICKILSGRNISIMHADIDSTNYNYALNCLEIDCSRYIDLHISPEMYKNKEMLAKALELIKNNLVNEISKEIKNNHINIILSNQTVVDNHHSARARQFIGKNSVSIIHQNNRYVLKIKTIDHMGLLYKIALILAKNNINIRQAHIITMGDRVEDTFFIENENLKDSNYVLNLEMKILKSIN